MDGGLHPEPHLLQPQFPIAMGGKVDIALNIANGTIAVADISLPSTLGNRAPYATALFWELRL